MSLYCAWIETMDYRPVVLKLYQKQSETSAMWSRSLSFRQKHMACCGSFEEQIHTSIWSPFWNTFVNDQRAMSNIRTSNADFQIFHATCKGIDSLPWLPHALMQHPAQAFQLSTMIKHTHIGGILIEVITAGDVSLSGWWNKYWVSKLERSLCYFCLIGQLGNCIPDRWPNRPPLNVRCLTLLC